jgi:hypothetical protein
MSNVLPQWETAQDSPEIIVNQNFKALDHMAAYGMDASSTTGLTWGYLGGRWGGIEVTAATVTLTASSTNYVVVNRSTGAVSVATTTTNWNDLATYARVYKLITDADSVTNIGADHDYRAGPGGVHGQVVGGDSLTGPGSSTDNTLPRWNGAGGDTLQGSGVIVSDDDEISGYKGAINAQTDTSYTLAAADTGKVVELTNAAAITLDMPNNLPVGWCCTVVQGGAGAVTFTPASGANRRNRQSHTKTAGQWAMCSLYVRPNSGGSAAEYVLGGDTAA